MRVLRPSVDFSLTLTTKGPFRKKDPSDQFDELRTILTHLPPFVKATLIAECHQDYTVHVHGIFSIDLAVAPSKYNDTPRKFLYDYYRSSKIIGFMKIDQITSFDDWVNYLKKNLKETYKALNRFPIIIDNYSIFDNTTVFDMLHSETV